MRVLCLHGKGTSGAIFKSQTSSFRSRLKDLNIEFDFVDGPYRSTPAPGIDLFYPAPYYSFWEDESTSTLKASCKWLQDLIAKNGPYDAVMMFSQGCALGALTLLLHEVEEPNSPPPFKAGIFICGGAPLSFLQHVGFDIPTEAMERDQLSRKALAAQADAAAILTQGSSRWGSGPSLALSEEEVRKEIKGPFKIPIQTVHIYGSKDPRFAAGIQLSEIFDPVRRKVYNHGGGHEIPRFELVSSTIADLVSWALKEGA